MNLERISKLGQQCGGGKYKGVPRRVTEKTSGKEDRGICGGGGRQGPSRRADYMMNYIDPLHCGGIIQQKDRNITVKLGDECI